MNLSCKGNDGRWKQRLEREFRAWGGPTPEKAEHRGERGEFWPHVCETNSTNNPISMSTPQ